MGGKPTDKQEAHVNNDKPLGAGEQEKSPGQEFFRGEAPEETGKERLERYIDYTKQRQTWWGPWGYGLIEIMLTDSQITGWKATLGKLGFKKVCVFTNGNTTRKITVFHLIF
jgi:hypothetical protein